MRGRTGVLRTGHWLVDTRDRDAGGTGATLGAVATTPVRFADLDDDEIDAYVATGEPLEVAGAFTVDGLGGAYVTDRGRPPRGGGGRAGHGARAAGQVGVPWHSLWVAP